MKKGLGRGLNAIFEDNSFPLDTNAPRKDEPIAMLRIADIEPNREQPRKVFDEAALNELSESIKQHGLIQPLLVEPMENGRYRIIAGERRWRACRIAEIKEVPAVIRSVTPKQMMELALIENLQREDLNPMEEAEGYKQLMELYHMTQEQVASSVGRSRPAVANTLRLLTLPEMLRQCVADGSLSAGHARAILALEDPDKMQEVAREVMGAHLSVRQTEQLIAKMRKSRRMAAPTLDAEVVRALETMEKSASARLGNQVKIKHTVQNRGKVEIPYYSVQELEKIIDAIMKGGEGYGR